MSDETMAEYFQSQDLGWDIPPTTWRMKNGTEIRIVDMDDNHLANTISMIKRQLAAMSDVDFPVNRFDAETMLSALLIEARKRGLG